MARRLIKVGHNCVVHDTRPDAVATWCAQGAVGRYSLKELSAKRTRPRERFASRGEADFGNQLLSAMRRAFGDHLEKTAGETR